ncbi:molybdopterin biosynthesis protein [Archaeoglobus profundus]|uniref:molybdopterin molybdotransferase n=1 Tax=Archaeoglobus profundus (strain DSM 5631 / JCM 9629 / NBRC 100127 / Av18) TaxID=572546 RepID=D2RGE1_ARCPA|nr:molybdopterin biosynthesis protein [Archaeoglobus profundus]ADB57366.1 molybdenum cofactor synthesis domain protein [Archaeoglobus profundus DSM 5631]
MRKVFRELKSLDEVRRILESLTIDLDIEEISIFEAYNRVLAEDVYAKCDVPPFDRATMDGFAVKAEDTFLAEEDKPIKLKIVGNVKAGEVPRVEVDRGCAVEISTGAVMPKGANAVVMVEYTTVRDGYVYVYKPVAPMENVASAGSDAMAGELIVRKGKVLSAREIGLIASAGVDRVKVFRKPKVAIISTGDEIVEVGRPLEIGKIYDVNLYMITSKVKECGCLAFPMGVVRDDYLEIKRTVENALKTCDIVITTGSTSAGLGDVIYRVFEELGDVFVHGIAVKPGKPTVIAKTKNKVLFGLPGYPVSALMIFEVVVAPFLRKLTGLEVERNKVKAVLQVKTYSDVGRREFRPVALVKTGKFIAYPFTTYSGSVSTLAKADGFIEIPENVAFLEEGEEVDVILFGDYKPSDLVIIGSHCLGVDLLIELCSVDAKVINVGSTGGLLAVKRGEADLAGTHLLDESGVYNIPFIKRLGLKDVILVKGYEREQGFIVAKGNPKGIRGFEDLLREDVVFINRNPGSGTRVLIDMKLRELAEKLGLSFEEIKKRIKGYDVEAKTHTAVAVAVLMGKADVGVGIRTVADRYGLDFIPLRPEEYDFVVRKDRLGKESVKRFLETLRSDKFKREVRKLKGIRVTERTGEIVEFS